MGCYCISFPFCFWAFRILSSDVVKSSFAIRRAWHLFNQQISDFYILAGKDLRFYQVCHQLGRTGEKMVKGSAHKERCVLWYEGKGVRGESSTLNQEYYAWMLRYMQEKVVRRRPECYTGFHGLGKASTSRQPSTTVLQQNHSHWQPWIWLNPWWHVCLLFNFTAHLFLLMILSISLGKTVTFMIIGLCYSKQC